MTKNDNRRAHRAKWFIESERIQKRLLALIEDPRTIPPDVVSCSRAWENLERLRMDLRMQPRPAPHKAPLPHGTIKRLEAQQVALANLAQLERDRSHMSPADYPLPAIIEATPPPQPHTQVVENQSGPHADA
jgi:hypothetical protein